MNPGKLEQLGSTIISTKSELGIDDSVSEIEDSRSINPTVLISPARASVVASEIEVYVYTFGTVHRDLFVTLTDDWLMVIPSAVWERSSFPSLVLSSFPPIISVAILMSNY